VKRWRREHPGEQIPDGQVFTQPWPAGPNGGRRDQTIYYQYKADRARRTLRGIDELVTKAEKAIAGQVPVKRHADSASDQTFIKVAGSRTVRGSDLRLPGSRRVFLGGCRGCQPGGGPGGCCGCWYGSPCGA